MPPAPNINLFLDSNTYLSFYKLSDDDLVELEKLAVTVRSANTVLYLPDHCRDEFERNRAGVINESIQHVERNKTPTSYPRLFTNLAGYAGLRATLNQLEKQRGDLIVEARAQARSRLLKADKLIEELFGLATRIELNDAIWQAAQRRSSASNPPGKKGSIGDALNWESLIVAVPDANNIVIVSRDGDYASRLDETMLDEFLAAEWRTRKQADASLETGLASLFSGYYPNIKIAADLEREIAIDSLVASSSFKDTHTAVQSLVAFVEFTPDQVTSIVGAAKENSQVRLILYDEDVRNFYSELLKRYAGQVHPDDQTWLQEKMYPSWLEDEEARGAREN
jgi:PIN domain-containing protein